MENLQENTGSENIEVSAITPEQVASAKEVFDALRVKAVGLLVKNNTFTQKNAEKFGVLGLNFLIKNLDKAGAGEKDAAAVKEIEEKIVKAKEALAKLEAKLSEANGQPSGSEKITKIVALAGTMDVSAAEISAIDLAKIADLKKEIEAEK